MRYCILFLLLQEVISITAGTQAGRFLVVRSLTTQILLLRVRKTKDTNLYHLYLYYNV